MIEDPNRAQLPPGAQELMALRSELPILHYQIDQLRRHSSKADYFEALARYGFMRQREAQLAQQFGMPSLFAVRRRDWLRVLGLALLAAIVGWLLMIMFGIALLIFFPYAF